MHEHILYTIRLCVCSGDDAITTTLEKWTASSKTRVGQKGLGKGTGFKSLFPPPPLPPSTSGKSLVAAAFPRIPVHVVSKPSPGRSWCNSLEPYTQTCVHSRRYHYDAGCQQKIWPEVVIGSPVFVSSLWPQAVADSVICCFQQWFPMRAVCLGDGHWLKGGTQSGDSSVKFAQLLANWWLRLHFNECSCTE